MVTNIAISGQTLAFGPQKRDLGEWKQGSATNLSIYFLYLVPTQSLFIRDNLSSILPPGLRPEVTSGLQCTITERGDFKASNGHCQLKLPGHANCMARQQSALD